MSSTRAAPELRQRCAGAASTPAPPQQHPSNIPATCQHPGNIAATSQQHPSNIPATCQHPSNIPATSQQHPSIATSQQHPNTLGNAADYGKFPGHPRPPTTQLCPKIGRSAVARHRAEAFRNCPRHSAPDSAEDNSARWRVSSRQRTLVGRGTAPWPCKKSA